jgi:uncharacterized protein YfaS (alpha-2-macroglobulin family)
MPLPPAVVETDPLPQSVINTADGLTIYFNQNMDRTSVEAVLNVQPTGGAVEWVDDATLHVIPAGNLEPATDITVTVGEGALAANRLALDSAVSFTYQTPDALRYTERLPKPGAEWVSASSAVVVSFNQPVVALGADSPTQPAAFTIEPPVNGSGEWLNTSTFIFYPEPTLGGGITYTVNLNPDLVSTAGAGLDPDFETFWQFNVALPDIINLEPETEIPIQLDDEFSITFNQPMDHPSTEGAFRLLDESGALTPVSYSWDEDSNRLTLTPAGLLARNTRYTLQQSEGALGLGGTPMMGYRDVQFITVPQLALSQTNPVDGALIRIYSGYTSGFSLIFSAPLAANQDWSSLITLSPAIGSAEFYAYNSEIYISGYFAPNTEYSVAISSTLLDKWGGAMVAPTTVEFLTGGLEPGLVMPAVDMHNNILTMMPWERELSAQVTGLSRLDLELGEISLTELMDALYVGVDADGTSFDTSWSLPISGNTDQPTTISVPLQPSGQPLPRGIYVFHAAAPGLSNYQEKFAYIVISQTQLLIKRSQNTVFVWAVDLASQTPIAGGSVTVYGTNGSNLGSGTTDAEGRVSIPVTPEDYVTNRLYVTLGAPDEANFGLATTTMTYGIQAWDFGLSVNISPNDPLTYLYTDRPIYRPGQTVYFRLVAQKPVNGRYQDPDVDNVQVTVRGEYDYTLDSQPEYYREVLPLSEFGTAESQFTLPEDAPPGYYYMETDTGYGLNFQVANYRKPEVDLTVGWLDEALRAGDTADVAVQAKYYFGAPAGGARVSWALYTQDDHFHLPGGYHVGTGSWSYWRYNGYADDYLGTWLADGTDVTAPDGTLSLTFDGARLVELLGDKVNQTQILTLEATFIDESGFPVSARGSLTLHPAYFYVGVRADTWTGVAGSELGFDIQTIDWLRRPWGNQALSASFEQVEWVDKGQKDYDGWPIYEPVYTSVGSTDFIVDGNGQARLAFTPPDPGTYRLKVTGDGAVTEYTIWVLGAGGAPWPRSPNQRIQLVADAESYQPGDTAQIFIPNPLERPVLALITVERGEVMRSQIVEIADSSLLLDLPLSEIDAPNVYISATLIAAGEGVTADFRMGYLNLKVDPAAELLNVSIGGIPETALPGDEVSLTVTVTDAAGQPVEGEFSLALVDKAVLALSDANSLKIEDAFYGIQDLGIYTSLSLASYGGRAVILPTVLGRGGGGGDGSLAPSVREDFRDAAFWDGSILTDANGQAVIPVKLPDNLTTWVADVRGITRDSRVGSGTAELIVSKPLLVRPVTPRFLVAGDHVELAAVVHNNTAEVLNANVYITATGILLDDPNTALQTVELAAGERRRVTWWGTVQPETEAELIFGANAGDYADLTRPSWGMLPILAYSAPLTYGTSGVLTEPGDTLEVVSLPRSFTPLGGQLRVEIAPSLAAAAFSGLETLADETWDYPFIIAHRLLPNTAVYRAGRDLGIPLPEPQADLEQRITMDISALLRLQKEDGGWGWNEQSYSDSNLTANVAYALLRAQYTGFSVNADKLALAEQYLASALAAPDMMMADWELDRLAFHYFVLSEMGADDLDYNALFELRDRLSPSAQALTALTLSANGSSEEARTLLSNLEAKALRSATGVHWQDNDTGWYNFSTPEYATAAVVFALARLDPASPLVNDAVRYLAAHRRPHGWGSIYQNAWVLTALTDVMIANGEALADYDYTVRLNDVPLLAGSVSGADLGNSTVATAPLEQLDPLNPNALLFSHGDGNGRLYYRSYLQVYQAVEDANPVNRGLSIARSYIMTAEDCRLAECTRVNGVALSEADPVIRVVLDVTVPEDMYYVAIEDFIPAGAEVVNLGLKTTQMGGDDQNQLYDPTDPYRAGWGWWYFDNPQISDSGIRWMAPYLPAGSYTITYRFLPTQAGEYRVLPARAWMYFFPEVEGRTAGDIFTIR